MCPPCALVGSLRGSCCKEGTKKSETVFFLSRYVCHADLTSSTLFSHSSIRWCSGEHSFGACGLDPCHCLRGDHNFSTDGEGPCDLNRSWTYQGPELEESRGWASLFLSLNLEEWRGRGPLVLFTAGEARMTSLIHSTNISWISFLFQALAFYSLFNEQPGSYSFFPSNLFWHNFRLREKLQQEHKFPAHPSPRLPKCSLVTASAFSFFSVLLLVFSKLSENMLQTRCPFTCK